MRISDWSSDVCSSDLQLSLLEACRKANPGIRLVFASTRQLYGRPDYLPVDEKHPIRPVDVNGINKLAGEVYHLLYSNVYDIRASVLRLTTTSRSEERSVGKELVRQCRSWRWPY